MHPAHIMSMAMFEKEGGYHIYQQVWDAVIDKKILPAGENQQTCISVINFTVYLFSCVKFLWIQLTLKIYYH